MSARTASNTAPLLGVGFYTVPEAARLLRIPAVSIRRWLAGYTYSRRGVRHFQPPLWTPQLPKADDRIELGFRDLIELRFVAAFIAEGLKLPVIRACLDTARSLVGNDHPFSTQRFKTDGRRIYLESLERISTEATPAELPPKHYAAAEAVRPAQVLDLRNRQYVFAQIVERTFRDLDIDADSVIRWRPYKGKSSIVVDPQRAFGQPITAAGYVPTVALAGAVEAEGSTRRVAYLYDIPIAAVRDAVQFETGLAAA